MKIGIIIVNYKDYANRFLAECRDSFRNLDFDLSKVTVYIVDNASSAVTQNYLKSNWPEAVILPRIDGNYAAANNLGCRQAIKDGVEFLVISNMDVAYDRNWLKELLASAKSRPNAIWQSKVLLYPDDKDFNNAKINSIGNKIHYLGFGFTTAYGLPDIYKENTQIKGYASGTSFIMSAEVFEKLQGYDEELYMYHDDLDLGWKAMLINIPIFLAVKSRIYHKYEFSRSIRMLYFMERNRFLVVFTYYNFFTLLCLLPFLIGHDFLMFFYAVANGWWPTKFKVFKYFLNPFKLFKIYKKRKYWQKNRTVKDSVIIDYFESELVFSEINNPILENIANPIMRKCWKLIKTLVKIYNYGP